MQPRELFRALLCNAKPHFKQEKAREFLVGLVLLRDRYAFYAWGLCGFVGFL